MARISEDGSHVYFVARGVLSVAANALGDEAVPGGDNLYVYEREGPGAGRTAFIATLSPADERDWARADDRPVLASTDGRYLVFTSVAELTHEAVAPGVAQVFRYDAQTGGLVRASIAGGNEESRGAVLPTQPVTGFDSPTDAASMSAPESGVVFFESAEDLVPRAPVPSVYEYDAGKVYLISSGLGALVQEGAPPVHLLGSDSSGEDVFFTSPEQMVAQGPE